MSDHDHQHEEIGRLLREQGQSSAPPDLAGEVMRRVRAEPQTHGTQRPLWRPVAAVAGIAAAVLAIAIGAGQFDLAGSGDSGSAGTTGFERSPTEAGGETLAPTAGEQTYTVTRETARELLGRAARPDPSGVIVVEDTGERLQKLKSDLEAAQASGRTLDDDVLVTIVLRRSDP